MKRIISVILVICCLFLVVGCKNVPSEIDVQSFSFSITFGTEGTSFYDSKTGELIRTKHSKNTADYTAQMFLSDSDIAEVVKIISELDINSYPDKYDPINDPKSDIIETSTPSRTIILTVTTPEFTKTIDCSNIAFGGAGYNDKAQKFLDAADAIVKIVTETDEWKVFPELDFGFV